MAAHTGAAEIPAPGKRLLLVSVAAALLAGCASVRLDRLAFSHELLAAAPPPGHVFRTDGGHDWPEWRRLWEEMRPVLGLPGCPSPSR